jgi:hypothetical protein
MSQVAENRPQYLSARIKHSQEIPDGSTWANKIINMNNVENQEGIEYSIDSGAIRLEGGKTYRITAQFGIDGEYYRTKPGHFFAFGLFTRDGVQIGPLAEALQIGLKSSNASGGLLDVIHTPAQTGDYCLKMAPNVKADSSIILIEFGAFLNIVQVLPGADVLSLRRFTNQKISPGTIWAKKNIILSLSKETNSNVAYDSSTGEFTLQGRKTYRITAQLGWQASSPGWYAFGLFDSKGTQIGPAAESLSANLNTPNASGAVLDVIHTPYTTEKFRLRMSPGVKAGASSSIRADVSTFLNIVSIPEQKSYVSARHFIDQPISIPPTLGWTTRTGINMQIREKCGTIKYSPDYGLFTLLGGKTYRITAQVGIQAKLPGYYSIFVVDDGSGDDYRKFSAKSVAVSSSYRYGTLISSAVYDVIISPLLNVNCKLILEPHGDTGYSSKIRADTSTFMNIVEL